MAVLNAKKKKKTQYLPYTLFKINLIWSSRIVPKYKEIKNPILLKMPDNTKIPQ
jgi:hypothetical protein